MPYLLPATKNFEISARTNLGDVAALSFSGEAFNYYISYTVPPLSDIKDSYSEASIQIEIPEHLSVATSGTALSVNGDDTEYSYIETIGGKYLTIALRVPYNRNC